MLVVRSESPVGLTPPAPFATVAARARVAAPDTTAAGALACVAAHALDERAAGRRIESGRSPS